MKSKPAAPDRRTISFKVLQEDYDRLKSAAAGDGQSFSAWCRDQLGAKAVKRQKAQKSILRWLIGAILYRLWAWVCLAIGLSLGAIAGTAAALLGWATLIFFIFGLITILD